MSPLPRTAPWEAVTLAMRQVDHHWFALTRSTDVKILPYYCKSVLLHTPLGAAAIYFVFSTARNVLFPVELRALV